MEFKNCAVYNFEGAFRGMRNPKNSWHLSDSRFGIEAGWDNSLVNEVAYNWTEYLGIDFESDDYSKYVDYYSGWLCENGCLSYDNDCSNVAYIGPKDMKLAKQLIAAGPEHRKFLRQIFVSVDITAPLFWWKEMDTYKVATVANSTSTMHKLDAKPICIDSFEIEDFNSIEYPLKAQRTNLKFPVDQDVIQMIFIPYLEYLRTTYNELKKDNLEEAQKYWKELVRWLPESWLQTRTWTCNYETLRSIYHQRKNHKLTEWHKFCEFIETLPYAKDLIID